MVRESSIIQASDSENYGDEEHWHYNNQFADSPYINDPWWKQRWTKYKVILILSMTANYASMFCPILLKVNYISSSKTLTLLYFVLPFATFIALFIFAILMAWKPRASATVYFINMTPIIILHLFFGVSLVCHVLTNIHLPSHKDRFDGNMTILGIGLLFVLCALLYFLNMFGFWRIYKGENPVTLGFLHPWTARNRPSTIFTSCFTH